MKREGIDRWNVGLMAGLKVGDPEMFGCWNVECKPPGGLGCVANTGVTGGDFGSVAMIGVNRRFFGSVAMKGVRR